MTGFLNESNQGQQKNMFLAIFLALGVILVWQAFMAPPLPPPPAATDGSGATEPAASAGANAEPAADVAEGSGAAVPVVPETAPLPALVVRSVNHDVAISNVGGRVESVAINRPEQYQPRESIIGVFPAAGAELLPLSLRVAGLADLQETSVYEVLDDGTIPNADGTYSAVAMRWTSPDGAIQVVRRYEADPREFGLRTSVEVVNRSQAERRFDSVTATIYGEFSDQGRSMFGQAASVLESLCAGGFGTERRPGRKVEEAREFGVTEFDVEFAGIDEQYFLTALVPESGTVVDRCSWAPAAESHVATRLDTGAFAVAPGASTRFDFVLYTGPKHDRYLDAFPGGLGRSVDFGLFSFLAIPIRYLLLLFHGWVANWGLAIIVLTIFIKIVLFPVTQKGYVSMEKMKNVQPKLSALQKKYENDRMKLAEEQMKLFKDEGVSPMGGCLPMLAQMPIYFALYRTIWGSAELYNAPFYAWVKDLSQPDPFFILPLAMGATMVIQQQLMPQAVDNPQMKMVNRIMPIMFTAMMLFLPSGLVLYIFVNMLLSILQMLHIRKKYGTPSPAPAAAR